MEKGGVVCSKESPRPLQCDPNEPGSCCGTGINSMADLTSYRQGMAFLLSSPFVNICNAPLSRLTILSQVQGMYSSSGVMSKLSLPREFSSVVKREGFKALWKGNLASIAYYPSCFAITMLTFPSLNDSIQSVFGFDANEDHKSATQVFAEGMSAGLSLSIATSTVYPMDLVRARLAAQGSELRYKGIRHAFRTIFKEAGLVGLYQGNGASVLRQASTVAICTYGAGELLIPYWKSQRPDDSELVRYLGPLGICVLISSMATYPVDLVKRRLQLDGGGGQPRVYNDGLFGTFKNIVKREGPRGLYRGFLPNFLKVFPRVGFCFAFYEMFKRNDAFSSFVTEEQQRFDESEHS